MAREFNGTTDNISVSDSTSIRSPSTAITIGLWWRRPTGESQTFAGLIVKKFTTGDPFVSYSIQQNSGSEGALRFFISDGMAGGLKSTVATTTLGADTWFFLVARWASGQQLQLRVFNADGTINQTVSSAASETLTIGYNTDPLFIGENEILDNMLARIAEIYVSDVRLADDELITLMYGRRPQHPSALYMPLYGDASPEPDFSGNGNSGTVSGATIADHPPIPPPFGFDLGWQGAFEAAAGKGVGPFTELSVMALPGPIHTFLPKSSGTTFFQNVGGATVSPTGGPAKKTSAPMGGASTGPTAVLQKLTQLTGTLMGGFTFGPTGTLPRKTLPLPLGEFTINPTGVLSSIPTFVITVGGATVSPTGVLTTASVVGQDVGGFTAGPSGVLTRLPSKLTGGFSLGPTADVLKKTSFTVGGFSASPSGALVKLVTPLPQGGFTVAPVGTLAAALLKIQAVGGATISPTGTLIRSTTFLESVGQATILPTGVLGRLPMIQVGGGSISPVGDLSRLTQAVFGNATLGPAAQLTKFVMPSALMGEAAVSPVGILNTLLIPSAGATVTLERTLDQPLSLTRSLDQISKLDRTLDWPLTISRTLKGRKI